MKRRDLLVAGGAAILGASTFPLRWAAAQDKKKQKILYFSRSAGFVHPPVLRKNGQLASSEVWFQRFGQEAGIDVVCSQDGAVFDGDINQFDAFVFYTSGELTGPCQDAASQSGSPVSAEGMRRFFAALESGKGFVGIHSATDTCRAEGVSPYIAMIGAEFLTHGAQQKAAMKIASPKFPGVQGLGNEFVLHDEWYAMHKFNKDLHVVLVQETKGMTGPAYQRPPFPATWARMQGKGRVYYTSMGHAEIWDNKTFKQVLAGGLAWTLRNADADVTPNIAQVAPGANQVPKE
jgi:type 1 glutamine amidotransferase